jgi:predicted acylesterase/phospholipase RssA
MGSIPNSTHTSFEYCDLVMKGGITSGIVYPLAIKELSSKYHFKNIGGTSAGAVAAVITAAAEYGTRRAMRLPTTNWPPFPPIWARTTCSCGCFSLLPRQPGSFAWCWPR